MSDPFNPGAPSPTFPLPSPSRPPEPAPDSLPEPLAVPLPEPENMPSPNEPLGFPGGMPPEIVPGGFGPVG